jgi:hypothetical protein
MIGGFIITGSAPKEVIIRGIGPSLQSAGLQDLVADPTLRLFGPTGSQFAFNDNWEETQRAAILASNLAPQHPLESAIVATLNPGAYTASVSGTNATTGVGLVEIYDLNQPGQSKLANISTRGVVRTGDNVMIGGFILGGTSAVPSKVVVRAVGPSLAQAGLNAPLANPTLLLVNSSGDAIGFNDNWQDDSAQAAELQALSLAPQNAAESAIVATLPPGLYTAVVSGTSGGTGIGLVEVYHVQ